MSRSALFLTHSGSSKFRPTPTHHAYTPRACRRKVEATQKCDQVPPLRTHRVGVGSRTLQSSHRHVPRARHGTAGRA
eukprot:6901676-Prymnesium_polylepis.1